MTVQVLAAKGLAQDVVWGEVRAEAEWAGLSPQGRAEIAYAQAAAQQSLILPDSLAIREAV